MKVQTVMINSINIKEQRKITSYLNSLRIKKTLGHAQKCGGVKLGIGSQTSLLVVFHIVKYSMLNCYQGTNVVQL